MLDHPKIILLPVSMKKNFQLIPDKNPSDNRENAVGQIICLWLNLQCKKGPISHCGKGARN